MAQAESITTAIRQLTSREQPPRSTSPVRQAHNKSIVALAGHVPHAVYAGANADDLNACHLAGAALDRRYFENLFRDLSAVAVRVIRTAGADWRAP